MARGQAQAAQNQLNTTNQVASQYGQQANQLYGTLLPQYQNLATNGLPGYSQATQNAIINQGVEGANANFATAADQAASTAARTNNPAGVNATLSSLARQKAAADANAAQAGEIQIANNQEQQYDQGVQAGLSGEQGLYGTSTGTMAQLYGLGPGTLNARAAGGPSPLWGIAQSAIGAAGTAACWVARAVYGESDWRPDYIWSAWIGWANGSRVWRVLMGAYLIFGEPAGAIVKQITPLRRALRPVFDWMLRKAEAE